MTDRTQTTGRISRFAKVILNDREQRALKWLLHSTDNGQIISGSELPNVMVLSGINKRLGRGARRLV